MKWVDYREKLGIGFNDNNKFQMLSRLLNMRFEYGIVFSKEYKLCKI